MTPLEVEPKFAYVLCKPDLAFSTPKLFAKLDNSVVTRRPDHRAMIRAMSTGDSASVGNLLCNVFEEAVLADYEDISQIKHLLLSQGALGAQMTGSGSVVFGIFSTEEQALRAESVMKQTLPNTFFCKTV